MSIRTQRVNELLRKELSWLLANAMHDPRVPLLVSITRVDTSLDLRHATVYISIMGEAKEKQDAVRTLQAAAGFLHRELMPRVELRYVPALSFKLDDSIEEGARTLQMLDQLQEPPRPQP